MADKPLVVVDPHCPRMDEIFSTSDLARLHRNVQVVWGPSRELLSCRDRGVFLRWISGWCRLRRRRRGRDRNGPMGRGTRIECAAPQRSWHRRIVHAPSHRPLISGV